MFELQASEVVMESDAEEHVEFVNKLHAGVLDSVNAFLHALDGSEKLSLMLPYMDSVFAFLGRVVRFNCNYPW